MNVALCHESVIPARGGCETYVADLLRRLDADGHEVHLYARSWDASSLPPSLMVHPIAGASGPRFLRPWLFAQASARALAPSAHDVVVGFIKTWRQDVILPQGGTYLASVRGNLRKHRRSLTRGLALLGKWLSPAHWSFQCLERRQFRRNDEQIIVVASQMVANDFRRHHGVSEQRLRVIPNAIDPLRFVTSDRLRERARLRRELDLAPDAVVGLFLGHNYRLKGLEPLLHAVAKLREPSFRLLACGGADFRRHERLAHRLGIGDGVRFLGFVSDVRSCFFAADFLVHPTFYDPGSLVVMEALACGLPVITTRYNGAAEVLHPPLDGIVLDDPWDVAALSDALARCLDAGLRREMTRAARAAANLWTFEDHYRALLAVFEEVARRKQAA